MTPYWAVVHFVKAFEDEELAFVAEACGDLRPYGTELGVDFGACRLVAGSLADVQPHGRVVVRAGTVAVAVVVNVDNRVEPGIFRITDDFGHAVHPSVVYLIVRSVADMPHPGDGDAHRREACCGHTVEKSLRGRGVVPARLVGDAVYMCIE